MQLLYMRDGNMHAVCSDVLMRNGYEHGVHVMRQILLADESDPVHHFVSTSSHSLVFFNGVDVVLKS